jgi:PAS domain S-box-containing protein
MSDAVGTVISPSRKVSHGVVGLCILVSLVVFAFDLMTPLGIAAAVPYGGLILLSRQSKHPPFAFILAGIVTGLTIVGFFLSPDGPPQIDLVNRGLSIFAIWLTAVMCYQHIELVLKLDGARRRLERQVVDTVSETVQVVAELESVREDQKQTEEELQDAEERFAAIFNQTYQLIAVLDQSGSIEEANDTFMMACAQPRHEVEGRSIWSLKALAGNQRFQDRLRAAVDAAAGGNFARTEIGFVDVNNKTLTMDASIKPIRDANSQIKLLIFEARDVTEQKQNLELLHQSQKVEVIGQLTSGIAHDFNNILAVIGGHLELAQSRTPSAGRRTAHVKSALEAVFRGRSLTQQLLSFSRKRRLRRRSVEVTALVQEAMTLVDRPLLKEIEIVTEFAEPTWPALTDPSELQTALLNLIVNSKDSMPSGGKITIKTANVALDETVRLAGVALAPGDYVLLSVIDEGEGIPPDLLDRITEPYFTTKAHGAGTGLGLSMVNQFAQHTGGALHIASTLGSGTAVTMYLPRGQSVSSAAPERIDGGQAPEDKGAGERILVVEDDPGVRDNLVAMLTQMGYRTIAVENGAEAISILEETPDFDLLFTDIALPGGYSGHDLVRDVSRFANGIKVLLTTGVPDHVSDQGLQSNGVPILAKPYRYAELEQAIRSVLDR